MKVYIVEGDNGVDNWWIEGIFDSEDKAKGHIELLKKPMVYYNYIITDWNVI